MLPLFLLINSIASASAPSPAPVDMPRWFGAADYPSKAQRKGVEGTVGYQLSIDMAGIVTGCRITASSGQAMLDRPTCDLLRARGRFTPAHDASGTAVASSYSGKIRWTLPKPPPVVAAAMPVRLGARRLAPPPVFSLSAPAVFEKTPEPVVDPAATRPPADPRIRFGQLPSGLRYAILRNGTPQGGVSFRFRIDGGSADETVAQAGYAHLIEHMIFRGSTHVPDGELQRSLEQAGLAMGSDTTAFTYPDATIFGLDFPPSPQSTVATGLFLLREVADRALISPGPLPAVRGVVLSERRARDSANLRMENARLAFLLPGQPVTRPTIGTLEAVTNASAEGLRAFYHEHYRPERSTLVVVGDVSPAELEADIRTRFADWKPTSPAPLTVTPPGMSRRGAAVRIFIDPGAPRYARIDWQSPYDTRPDDYLRQADYVANTIVFEILNSRLLRTAARLDAPFSGAAAGQEALFHSAIDTSIAIQPLDGKLRPAIATILTEQRRVTHYGVSQAEFDRAVARIRTHLAEAAASADLRGSSDLADGILSSVINGSVFVTPRQNEADVDRLIRHMTLADVNRAAVRLFSGSGPLLFVSDRVMPPGGEAALKAALIASAGAPIAPPPAVASAAWPYANFGKPGRVIERKELPDLGVTIARFANGTTATIKQSPGTGQVFLNLAFGSGLSGLPEGRDHALWLLSQSPETFVLGGLGKADVADINDSLFGKMVGATLVTSTDRFQLMGRTRPADIEAEAQLLTAYVVDPAFRPRALHNSISGAASLRSQLAASVPLTAARDLAFLLHDGDPRWRITPSAADLQATKSDDLPALLRPALAGPLNLVIVGDIDVEQALQVAQNTVGALPPRGPRPTIRDARFPASATAPVTETVPGAAAQGMAVAAWPTDAFTANMADSRAVQVLAQVIKARLMAGLREREGLTYSPEVFVDQAVSQRHYATLGVQVELPPSKAEIFFTELDTIVRDLAQTPIKADELARARTPMVDASRRGFGFAEYWIDALAASDDNPAYFDMIRSKVPDLEKVTPADVQRLAARYLASRNPFRFVVQPGMPEPAGIHPRSVSAAR
jgi:zinc protease